AIDEVLKSYGTSLAEIENWGGKVMEAPNPSGPERRDHILSGKANAVFDEGVKSWGATALHAGMRFLPISERAARHMARIGFPAAILSREHYQGLERDINTIDFSGWTYFCHAELQSYIAYNMAKAVDICHKQIPVDHFDKRAMNMMEFCRGGEAGQLNIPLHPGAKKYYREMGYL
ncbi:MAG TPA: TAXI family TRAP transporter solute-binding subunit, partial [Candidatus Binatia bacterium]|nr:TAXI family TRAP transporter solute-binding subunit [Candidatus Binatia bacterium]